MCYTEEFKVQKAMGKFKEEDKNYFSGSLSTILNWSTEDLFGDNQ